jgi:hypothetical protein
MNEVLEKTIRSRRAVFALFFAIALAFQGAQAVELPEPFVDCSAAPGKASESPSLGTTCLPALGISKDELTRSGKPVGDQYAYLVLPLILKTDNPEDRLRINDSPCRETNQSSTCRKERFSVQTSTSLVSSHLGRRLTLVGAKPSGTG